MNPTNSAQALTSLQSAQKSSQDPNTILQQQQNQLGVTGAQQTVSGLRGAIDNTTKVLQQVAPSVMGRTANSLVTNAQASKQIQNEQAPISQNLTQEGTQYNNATSDLNNLQNEAQTAASGLYQGQQNKISYAQNLYNTLFAKEQAAQQAKQQAAAFKQQQSEFKQQQASSSAAAAENRRQFNADLAEKQREANLSARASSNSGLGSDFTGSQATANSNSGMNYSKNNGFQFTSASGKPISVLAYAQANSIPVNKALNAMVKEGKDVNAAAALKVLNSNGTVNSTKLAGLNVSSGSKVYNNTLQALRTLGFKV